MPDARFPTLFSPFTLGHLTLLNVPSLITRQRTVIPMYLPFMATRSTAGARWSMRCTKPEDVSSHSSGTPVQDVVREVSLTLEYLPVVHRCDTGR